MAFTGIRRAAALLDGAGLLLFTAIGIAMHGAGFGPGPILRNVVPILGGWYLLAPLTRVYARVSWSTLLLHWILAVPAGVLVRQLWVGRLVTRATVVFLVASLVFTLVLLAAGRLILWLRQRRATAG